MKIRIKGNTIRYRLSQSEVKFFSANAHLEEKTDFGNTQFSYALEQTKNAKALTASFRDGRISLYVPEEEAIKWTQTNLVGLSAEMNIGNGKTLFLLLEKDFKCLDETHEDQSDNFPNPLAEKHGK
jgi:hypothetical protein